MSVNIEELKAQVKALQAKNKETIRERAEVARLKATLALESSDVLLDAKVRLAVKDEQTQTLQTMVDECAAIIASVPIHNNKTRSERVWAGNHRYNYGTQIDLLYQLATGILYSCQEHKALLLAHVPVSLELLEQFIKAFGTPSYYSRNHHTVVESKPANIVELGAVMSVLQSALGVVVDTSDLTVENLEYEFLRGEVNAQNDLGKANEAISEATFEL